MRVDMGKATKRLTKKDKDAITKFFEVAEQDPSVWTLVLKEMEKAEKKGKS
jgi:hypothetical protein